MKHFKAPQTIDPQADGEASRAAAARGGHSSRLSPSLVLLSLFALGPVAQAAALTDVTEIGSFSQIYQLNIPIDANYDSGTPAYGVNNAGTPIAGGIARIGYYMELQIAGGARQWVWTSMNAYTQNLGQIGVPVSSTGAIWQMLVGNLNVESNVGGIVTGSGIATGNIEFWHHCYGQANSITVPNASGSTYDFGDSLNGAPSCYGSMQVHNHGARQTLLAWNRWDAAGADDLGIGNRGTSNPDWTFAYNAGSYTVRNLEVWVQAAQPVVQQVPEPGSLALVGLALAGLAGLSRRRAAG